MHTLMISPIACFCYKMYVCGNAISLLIMQVKKKILFKYQGIVCVCLHYLCFYLAKIFQIYFNDSYH